MAFTTRTTLKTQSDAAAIQVPVPGSLTEALINTKVNLESNRTDTSERIYRASFILDADVNGRTSPVDIIQSDDSKILLSDLVYELNNQGLSVAYKARKTRDGINDKVILKVGWN